MSAVLYLEAGCDTQPFEVGCGEKICPCEQICIRGVFDLQDYNTLSVL